MTRFFVGIDGGGTSCRAALADIHGVVLGEGESGAANVYTDADGAVRHIKESAQYAAEAAGLNAACLENSFAVLGLAGANLGSAVADVSGRLPFAGCSIETDAWIAAHGALARHDGAIAVLGTGSVFARKTDGEVTTIGGWGFVVGDQGSGAALGRSVLSEALLAHDRVRPGSPVTMAVLSDFDLDPNALSAFARKATPGDFARYAPMIFEAADDDDPVACRILRAAATDIDDAIRAVLGTADRLCLLGGLGGLYEKWLCEEHRRCVTPAVGNALVGATRLALQRYGLDEAAHG